MGRGGMIKTNMRIRISHTQKSNCKNIYMMVIVTIDFKQLWMCHTSCHHMCWPGNTCCDLGGMATSTLTIARANMSGHMTDWTHVNMPRLIWMCHTHYHHMMVSDLWITSYAAHVVRSVTLKVCSSQGMLLSMCDWHARSRMSGKHTDQHHHRHSLYVTYEPTNAKQ